MTISTLSIVALGFVLGTRHATDADHVIAVTTIVSGHRSLRPAALIGALWGVGHTVTIFIVGSGIILFNWVIPIRVGLAMEMAVGVMLILLGGLKLRGSVHVSAHDHGDSDGVPIRPRAHGEAAGRHSPHDAPIGRPDRVLRRVGACQWLRPLAVGVVHGLAGSAAVALLVLSTIRDPRWAVTYLLVFGVGTIAGMMLLTTAVAIPFVYTNQQFTLTNRRLQVSTGLISVCFGLLMAYHLSSQFGVNF
jgi:high-affinity nickel-transport protein